MPNSTRSLCFHSSHRHSAYFSKRSHNRNNSNRIKKKIYLFEEKTITASHDFLFIPNINFHTLDETTLFNSFCSIETKFSSNRVPPPKSNKTVLFDIMKLGENKLFLVNQFVVNTLVLHICNHVLTPFIPGYIGNA